MTERMHGPWTIHRSRLMYQDPWIELKRDDVTRPDGEPGTYATVTLKHGVCVLAIDTQKRVYLTREFHYAVGRETLEGVSGGIEEGETPLLAAKRELQEELGLEASRFVPLSNIDPFTAAIYSTVQLYVAEGLEECDAAPEGTELIERVVMPIEKALRMAKSGEITHGPTCILLLSMALGWHEG